MRNPMQKAAMRAILSELPRNYSLLRVVSVALDVLHDTIADNEPRIVERYGTELLEILHAYGQKEST